MLKRTIVERPAGYDSDDVYWNEDDGVGEFGTRKGYGYRGRDDGKICILRCPACQRENYAMAVADGVCAWCGYDANECVKCSTKDCNQGDPDEAKCTCECHG